ncbi:hypothetical protein ACGFNU_34790 [Spirillospora sp. NPDC048911]|uniref:hypothetical protein n=1 Tax=Spirillospora sp. NPDC048911 TaxID=3364527 RepID=UPI003719DB65
MITAPYSLCVYRRRHYSPRTFRHALAMFAVPMTALPLAAAMATPASAGQSLTAKYVSGNNFNLTAIVEVNEHETVDGEKKATIEGAFWGKCHTNYIRLFSYNIDGTWKTPKGANLSCTFVVTAEKPSPSL